MELRTRNNTQHIQPKVYILHENNEWFEPLKEELELLGVPYESWFIHEGRIDLSQAPPEGIFFSRMSASSHTRNHRFAIEFTETILAWLEAHGRRVINGTAALRLEESKAKQHIALQQHGIQTPKTYVVSGKQAALDAARKLGDAPFIVKPNRGGKGLGVQLFHSLESFELALDDYLNVLASVDGIYLIQEYIKPKGGHINRVEFINGQLYYAVEVDTSQGFELCPADACNNRALDNSEAPKEKFRIIDNYQHPYLARFEQFLQTNQVEVASIEYLQAADGEIYVYDINTNTNYNWRAEQKSTSGALKGTRKLAEFLFDEWSEIKQPQLATSF
ncbi:ATP-grasp domain-containing protein [Microscilla marina]|uniref:Glutathione synthase n=1 Tax=Microscilla marina ATCC 23134 TaxID=313606 RepID=A1ZG00_MICM2|nr:alpha-L-glutamate ligase [Microscilla marina]EAY30924.1 glutathione synthase [Microscilla marina ATCC 23134]